MCTKLCSLYYLYCPIAKRRRLVWNWFGAASGWGLVEYVSSPLGQESETAVRGCRGVGEGVMGGGGRLDS